MINDYKDLEGFIYKQIADKKKVEFELDRKWFFFLIRLIYFYINGVKIQKDNEKLKSFKVTINQVKCLITLKHDIQRQEDI